VAYRIEVSYRPDSSAAWQLSKVWYANKYKNTYERVEDDLRFVKMTFPPVVGSHWAGNHYLPTSDTTSDIYKRYHGWDYKYTDVNAPKVIGRLNFDSTLTITEVDKQNAIDNTHSLASYALHVGLVYREWDLINKQDVASSWDNPNKANGFRIRMRVQSYIR
jgi:hypothetical protein